MAKKMANGYSSPSAATLNVPKITKAEKRKARLFVCGAAQNAEDARLLMDMLGLI